MAIYPDIHGTSTALMYSASNMLSTAPVMVKQETRNLDGPSLEYPYSDYLCIVSSADDLKYCCLCLACSHVASICQLLNEATQNIIISHRHVNSANLLRKKLILPRNCSQGCSDWTISSSCSTEERRPRRSRRITPNTYRAGNHSPWDGHEAKPLTGTSGTILQEVAPPAQPTSIQRKS